MIRELALKIENVKFIFDQADEKVEAEDYAQNYFRKLGYNCEKPMNLKIGGSYCPHIDKTIINKIMRVVYKNEPGMPDFICWKNKSYFWVEVKTGDDGIKIIQLKWAFNHKIEHIVYYCLEVKSNNQPH